MTINTLQQNLYCFIASWTNFLVVPEQIEYRLGCDLRVRIQSDCNDRHEQFHKLKLTTARVAFGPEFCSKIYMVNSHFTWCNNNSIKKWGQSPKQYHYTSPPLWWTPTTSRSCQQKFKIAHLDKFVLSYTGEGYGCSMSTQPVFRHRSAVSKHNYKTNYLH